MPKSNKICLDFGIKDNDVIRNQFLILFSQHPKLVIETAEMPISFLSHNYV